MLLSNQLTAFFFFYPNKTKHGHIGVQRDWEQQDTSGKVSKLSITIKFVGIQPIILYSGVRGILVSFYFHAMSKT